MNTNLKTAQKAIKRLQKANDAQESTIDFVLIFDRSEADMKRLIGYDAFSKALEELGGERTEEIIQEACKQSCFSRESVFIEGDEQVMNRTVKAHCSSRQAKAFEKSLIR